MTTLAQKIATEWLASKVVLAAPVRIKPQGKPHPSGARSDSKYEIILNGDKHDLIAKHDKGSWGLHTYKLLLDGVTIGWLHNHAVMATDHTGESEFDYMERSVSNSFKRPIINDSEDSEEKVLAKAIEMMFRRGDLADAGIHKFARGSNWATKALEKIINKEWLAARHDKPFDTRQPFAVIAGQIKKALASWDITSTVKVEKETPKQRWGDVNYVLNVQVTPPDDMDPTEFLGVMGTVLEPSRPFTLRQLQRGGNRWTFRVVLSAVDPSDWDY